MKDKKIKLTELQQSKFNKYQAIKYNLQTELKKISEQKQDLIDIIFEVNKINPENIKHVKLENEYIIIT